VTSDEQLIMERLSLVTHHSSLITGHSSLVVEPKTDYRIPVRRLAQPEVLKSAAIAAVLTTLLCTPRLLLWARPKYPIWYQEAVLFFGSIVLWSFVFAWHNHYSGRAVFTLKITPRLAALATLAGIGASVGLWFGLDPILRVRTPGNYPTTIEQWIARALFGLAFLQLFLTFAPFAWVLRLFRNPTIAAVSTVLFGVVVLALQNREAPGEVPPALFVAQLLIRVVMGSLSLFFYLRGGVLLAWWWGFLVELRHAFALG
jgi:hypothetical protein